MRIAYCSDLHLEFGDITLENRNNTDVLILAGDVCEVSRVKLYLDFFADIASKWSTILYVLGNHEYYHGDIIDTVDNLRESLKEFKNITVLDNNFVDIEGVRFIGSTLWTDMNNEDYITISTLKRGMNDFHLIKDSSAFSLPYSMSTPRFLPETAYMEHKKSLDFIDIKSKVEKVVVISHHAPSKKSIAKEFKNDTIMNGGYVSDLEHFIEDRPQIAYWVHGHTHTPFEYVVGETSVVCNPRGYKSYEIISEQFKLKYFEV